VKEGLYQTIAAPDTDISNCKLGFPCVDLVCEVVIMMSRFTSLSSPNIPLYISAGAASLCLFAVFRSIHTQRKRDPAEHVVTSPLSTAVLELSSEKIHRLPYPPDLFPGARDVETPYGSTRVYEWGPEGGRKVVLVHGISTPCISLGSIAEKLVHQGCRVILFGKLNDIVSSFH
jgi:hypothetical protein